jgi:hypothetical protein
MFVWRGVRGVLDGPGFTKLLMERYLEALHMSFEELDDL